MCFDATFSRKAAVLLVLAGLLAATPMLAQPPKELERRHNPIEAQIFPPDLVMAHQREIGLSADQRRQIIAGVQQMEADLVPLRFEMSEVTQQLADLLSAPKVDEEQALALVDRVTRLEGEIKKRHLTLVIRTKNLLSADQQSQLREIRGAGRW